MKQQLLHNSLVIHIMILLQFITIVMLMVTLLDHQVFIMFLLPLQLLQILIQVSEFMNLIQLQINFGIIKIFKLILLKRTK